MTAQVREDTFDAYNRRIAASLSEQSCWVRAAKTSGPTARFRRLSNMAWEALHHPGYTLITPPFEDETNRGNAATYSRLSDLQADLFARMGSSKLAPAPTFALHLTVGDLIADLPFMQRVCGGAREGKFREAVATVLADFKDSSKNSLPRFQVAGLSLFEPGFVVALLTAQEEAGYARLMALRDHIYGGPLNSDYGVERRFPFTGHVTAAYVEDVLTRPERDHLAQVLLDLNRGIKEIALVVEAAELRRFDGMQRFSREQNWPTYRFV